MTLPTYEMIKEKFSVIPDVKFVTREEAAPNAYLHDRACVFSGVPTFRGKLENELSSLCKLIGRLVRARLLELERQEHGRTLVRAHQSGRWSRCGQAGRDVQKAVP